MNLFNKIDEYKKKFLFAAEAVKLISSGCRIRYAFGDCSATMLDTALAMRKEELRDISIYSDSQYSDFQVLAADPSGECFSLIKQISKNSREALLPVKNSKLANSKYSIVRRKMPQFIFFTVVSPMDQHGNFRLVPGVSSDKYWEEIQTADYVIVEINENISSADNLTDYIHISQINYVVPGLNASILNTSNIKAHSLNVFKNSACI
ncbi:MAG: hypothetical protein ABFD04_00635 [Syntrophomonas sp.]